MSIDTINVVTIIIAIIAVIPLILYMVGFRLTELNLKFPFPEVKLVRKPHDKTSQVTGPSTNEEQIHEPPIPGTQSSASASSAILQQQSATSFTKSQHRRLESEKQDLTIHIETLSEKISDLRHELALETRSDEKLRLQAAINDNEVLRTELETKLDNIESQLE